MKLRSPITAGLLTVVIAVGAVALGAGRAAAGPDVVTPIDAEALPPATAPQEAQEQGRYVYDRPTPQNAALLLVDHQVGLMSGVQDFTSLAEYKNNVVALAKTAKAMDIPVILTSSNAQWQNGDLLPELTELFPDAPGRGAATRPTRRSPA